MIREILLISSLFVVFSFHSLAQSTSSPVDEMPYFPGCDDLKDRSPEKRACSDENLVVYISDYLEYPDSARSRGIEGTVYVSFTIDAQGKVTDPKIGRDIGGGCGQEALRIVREMPRWEPGRYQNQAVPVDLNLPINFSLKKAEDPANTYTISWGKLKGTTILQKDLKALSRTPIVVRDAEGTPIELFGIYIAYKKNRIKKAAESRDASFTRKMKRIIRKSRKGGNLAILATIQKNGQFLEVKRLFEIKS